MLPHLDTLCYFPVNKTLLLIFNAARFAEKQQIPILQSLIAPD